MSRHDQFDFLYKIVMIGDSGVGKTNLLARFVEDSFTMDSKPTIGVQFATKTINLQNKVIKNQIWDTAGQERFRAITNAYYRGAVGAIIAYDLTKSKTFENVQKWLNQLKQNAQPNITVMLLGNKSDLVQTRQVQLQTAQDYSMSNKLIYLQTSAASGQNVNQAFTSLIKQIYQKMKQAPQQKKTINDKKDSTSTTTNYSQQKSTSSNTKQSNDDKKNKKNIKLKGQKNVQQKNKKKCC